jgi:hypothetical protein
LLVDELLVLGITFLGSAKQLKRLM